MEKRKNDPTPPYLRVAHSLRALMEGDDPKYRPGDKLPTYKALEAKYEVSNMTARNAVAVMRDEGRVYSVPGCGTYVCEPDVEPAPPGESSLLASELAANRVMLEALVTEVRKVRAEMDGLWRAVRGDPPQ